MLSIFIFFTTYFIGISQVINKVDSLPKNDTIFYPNDPDPNAWVEYETMPEFPGGDDSLVEFAKKHLVYPRTLIKDSIEGRIIIKFSVDRNGFAGEVGFLKSLHPELENECIEMVHKLPRFNQGLCLQSQRRDGTGNQ